ncbi:hypothetical protein ACFLYP_00065 [Chloroflexota bacterium]
MAYIIEPIALLCWTVWRIASSVDQNIYWMLLIVSFSILVINLVLSGKHNAPRSAYTDKYRAPGRVENWQKLIENASLRKNETEHLRDELKNLLISVITQGARSDSINSEEIVEKVQESLPLAAHQFLFPPTRQRGISSIRHQLKSLLLAPRWLRKWTRKFISQDNTSIEEILRWMEIEMEINHEK